MKHPTQKRTFAVMLAALLAALAAFVTTSQAQVTLSQVTNGLVSYYPLDQLVPGSTNTTPDVLSRRDMTMYLGALGSYMNGPAYIVAGSHPGMGDSTAVMNLSQTPLATVLVYISSGQNPLDGSGDFLPFINQRGATMNFWLKGNVPGGQDQRVMAECANNGDNVPFFSLSSQPGTKISLGYFLRATSATSDPNGVNAFPMPDGTWELPVLGNGNTIWNQAASYCTNTLFDNNWHMLTTVIETNGDLHVFVDGNYDQGANSTTDNEGNLAMATPMGYTNWYYTTNNYPLVIPPTTNPPPNGFVRWMLGGLNVAGASTAFGGFQRNGGLAGGPPVQLSDIGFWSRPLKTNEIQFVMTNGISGLPFNSNAIKVVTFSADFKEVGTKHGIQINWDVIGANTTPGGIVISGGIGDVSSTPAGSVVVPLGQNGSYTFNLVAHNGVVADKIASVSVQTLNGVPSSWNLIQRFDGVFGNTTAGINGNGWVGLTGYYAGNLDRFNVVTVNNNKVLSPKSGYQADSVNSPVGWDSQGALAYGFLNGLTVAPFKKTTLFFRFSLGSPTPMPYAATFLYSGLDLVAGITDFGFATGPIAGQSPPVGNAVGPGFHIIQADSNGQYQPAPWDLKADDYDGTSVTNSYDYLTAGTGSPSGLQTNVNYMLWLDVSNDNTMQNIVAGSPPTTNTINEPVYSLWIQKQGDLSRTQLFSGFHGDRNWSTAGQNSDNPSAFLNKVFVSVATQNILNSDQGAFFATNNMILIDDFYLSTNGYNATIPRLFNITSVVRGSTNATVTWESLGSLFQVNTYSIQRTLSLNPASWTTLATNLPSGGDFTSYNDTTVGSASVAFYRISWP
jgi:hypothetical protein